MKNVDENVSFAMMIKKLKNFLVGFPTGQEPQINVFWLFCPSEPRNTISTKLRNRCIWNFYNIPPNFKPKYLQENFFIEENL